MQTPPPAPRCLDCEAPITGRFCASCGQRSDPQHKSLREFFNEFTEGLTNFDAKLWRTLPPLTTRPGFLTAEFNAGRRTRYVHPFRVYLFVTFVFFGLLAVFGGTRAYVETSGDASPAEIQRSTGSGSALDRVFARGVAKLQGADTRAQNDQFVQHLPQVMFVVLPAAALLLKAAYGRKRFYVEHLVFVTHVHSFAFVLFALFVVLPPLPHALSQAIPMWGLFFYFVIALHRVYGERLVVTLAKASVLSLGYTLLVVFGAALTTVLVMMTL